MTKEYFLEILETVSDEQQESFMGQFRERIAAGSPGDVGSAMQALAEAIYSLTGLAEQMKECAARNDMKQKERIHRVFRHRLALSNDMLSVMTDAWMMHWENGIREQFGDLCSDAQV